MQLSPSTSSADISLASLLLPPSPTAGGDGEFAPGPTAPAGTARLGFAELFPTLAATGSASAEIIPASTSEQPVVFSLAAPATNVAGILPPVFDAAPTGDSPPLPKKSDALTNTNFVAPPTKDDVARSTTQAETAVEVISLPVAAEKSSRVAGSTPRRSSASAPRVGPSRTPLPTKDPRPENPVGFVWGDAPLISTPIPPMEFSADVTPESEADTGMTPMPDFSPATPGVKSDDHGSPVGVGPMSRAASANAAVVPTKAVASPEVLTAAGSVGSEDASTATAPQSGFVLEPKPATDLEAAFEPTPTALPPAAENLPRRAGAPVPRRNESVTTPSRAEANPSQDPVRNLDAEPVATERLPLPDFQSETSSAPIPVSGSDVAARQPTDLRRFVVENPAAEKFADGSPNFREEKNNESTAPEKTFLSAAAKRVVTRETTLGTAVAKSETAMSTATFSNRPPSPVALERAPVAAPPVLETAPAIRTEAPIPAEATATAHRAVEAVMTAVERFSSGDRHAVNMQFSVGGADLTVRVELRADQVHATFRTDSPELRAALATEWSAATPNVGDRSLRLAPPVFAAGQDANLGAFSSDTSPRERDGRARRTAEEFPAVSGARSRASDSRAPAPTEFLSRFPGSGGAGTALHLSTLA